MTITTALIWYFAGAIIVSLVSAWEQSHKPRATRRSPVASIGNGLLWPALPVVLLAFAWTALVVVIQNRKDGAK